MWSTRSSTRGSASSSRFEQPARRRPAIDASGHAQVQTRLGPQVRLGQGGAAPATAEAQALPRGLPARRASLWRDALERLARNRLAMAGLAVILGFACVALVAPLIAPYDYRTQLWDHIAEPPSRQFPMGTDLNGRDMLSRMIYGARISMTVGLVAQLIVVLIGVPVGAIAGYYGGRLDTLIMRVVDVMSAFPTLLFVILIMTMLGRGLFNIFIAIGLIGWVTLARLVRGQLLSIREKEFVLAARAIGAPTGRIILRHLLPNALTPIIVAVTFGVPHAIFTEAALSFVGVGINPPTPSWGQMVGEYQQYIRASWHMSLFPATAIGLLMLAFTFFGDGLRDALDPRMKRA
jgi:ABC-type dipeptide/oligopeptide/nickel transport system permease subunit